MDKMNQWNANTNLDELNEFGIDEIVEEYDAEEICGKNGWINADYEEAVPSLINNTGANNNFKNGFVPTDVSNNYIRNFKYTTAEDEICLTDLAERLGNIDNIQVVNNPINAKITCNDNLISVENQGVYGLVQMKVSGHNLGEAKSAHTENIFVELSSEYENEEDDVEENYDDDYVEELDAEEMEEFSGGKTPSTTGNSVKVKICSGRYQYTLRGLYGRVTSPMINTYFNRKTGELKISKSGYLGTHWYGKVTGKAKLGGAGRGRIVSFAVRFKPKK